MGTNKCASQSGMTAYGTRRHLYDPKNHILPPMDHSTISLQMGTNKCASQVGLSSPPGPPPTLPNPEGSSLLLRASPAETHSGFPSYPSGRACSDSASACCVSQGKLLTTSVPQFPSKFCPEAHPTLIFLDPAVVTFPAMLVYRCDAFGAFRSWQA